MSPLRGYADYLELVGRRGGGPWWLLVLAIILALTAVEIASRVWR